MNVRNSERDIQIRRYQDTTIIVGMGIIVFSLWTVVKSLSVLFFRRQIVLDEARTQYDSLAEVPDSVLFGVMVSVIIMIMIADLILRVYVGRSAMAEGRGMRKSPVYLFFTVLLISGSISTLVNMFRVDDPEVSTELVKALGGETTPSSIIIELTSLVMMCEMLYSAIKLRKIRKQERLAEGR